MILKLVLYLDTGMHLNLRWQMRKIQSSASKMMADIWQEGRILRVVRREPHATGAAKILPLHILGN